MALRAAGLVTATRQGRNQLYRIDAEGFARAVGPCIAKYQEYLSGSLETLRTLAESSERNRQ